MAHGGLQRRLERKLMGSNVEKRKVRRKKAWGKHYHKGGDHFAFCKNLDEKGEIWENVSAPCGEEEMNTRDGGKK